MSKIVVLGAGMVGRAMARDLSVKHSVTSVDFSKDALESLKKNGKIKIKQADLSDEKAVKDIVKDFDLVICAVPGFMGFRTLKAIIEAGKNVVDISFFPENSLELDELARKKKVTAIVDCGVAPGMDNFILGYYNSIMKLTDFECIVGGLPKVKKWPFYYKAPFSPIDVIEEYTRPARYVENGQVIVKPAMSDTEYIQFEGVGTLESFNSDGLRSIIYTMPHIPNLKEKTLRYPGHISQVMALKESGFFAKKPIKVAGKEISPIDFTCKILFNEWKLGETEEEITVMKVSVTGTEKNKRKKVVYTLFDEYDKASQTSSMARTTGYTATAAANMMLDGLFADRGVFPPELIGDRKKCFTYILNYLKQRNVKYTVEETIL